MIQFKINKGKESLSKKKEFRKPSCMIFTKEEREMNFSSKTNYNEMH